MNRTIKFRGIRIDNGQWIFGYLYQDETGTYIKEPNQSGRFGCGCPVIPESVGQFTGLTNKEGIEIYEGDVMDYGLGRSFYVSYVGHQFVATFSDHVINSMIPIYNFPIIGSIHTPAEVSEQK